VDDVLLMNPIAPGIYNLSKSGSIQVDNEPWGYTQLTVNLRSVSVTLTAIGDTYPVNYVGLPGIWTNLVGGLCGTYDGASNDDFLLSNGTTFGDDITDDQIFDFGLSWRVPENESNFGYGVGPLPTYLAVNEPGFVPTFNPTFVTPMLQQQAQALCGSFGLGADALAACLFDVAATSDLDSASGSAINQYVSCLAETGSTSCLVNADCPNYCNFRGSCSGSTCTCNPNWGGNDCSIKGASPTTPHVSSATSVVSSLLVVALAVLSLYS